MEYNSYHMIKTVIMTCGGMVDGGTYILTYGLIENTMK